MGFRESNKLEYIKQKHVLIALIAMLAVIIGAVYTGAIRLAQMKHASEQDTYSACRIFVDDDNLCRFAASSEKQEFKNTIVTTHTTNGPTQQTEKLEFESLDKFKSITSENNKEIESYIAIDDMTYLMDYPNDSWVAYKDPGFEKSSEGQSYDFRSANSSDVIEFNNNYRLIGTEACSSSDDAKCYKYEILDNDSPELKTHIWFGSDDFLLRRLSINSGESTTSTSYSYETVTISPPAKYRELTEEEVEDYL